MTADEESRVLLASIDAKLDMLVRLFATEIGADQSIAERAPLLKRAGLSSAMIAAICGTTANAVNARLAESSKKSSRKKGKPRTRIDK